MAAICSPLYRWYDIVIVNPQSNRHPVSTLSVKLVHRDPEYELVAHTHDG